MFLAVIVVYRSVVYYPLRYLLVSVVAAVAGVSLVDISGTDDNKILCSCTRWIFFTYKSIFDLVANSQFWICNLMLLGEIVHCCFLVDKNPKCWGYKSVPSSFKHVTNLTSKGKRVGGSKRCIICGGWSSVMQSFVIRQNDIKLSFLMTKVAKYRNLHVDTFNNTKYKFLWKLDYVSSLVENWDKISRHIWF